MLETVWESRWLPDYGGIAQLGEHLPCKQGVESSNLSVSTESRYEADTEMNMEHLSGGDALRGHTRSHPEHDG